MKKGIIITGISFLVFVIGIGIAYTYFDNRILDIKISFLDKDYDLDNSAPFILGNGFGGDFLDVFSQINEVKKYENYFLCVGIPAFFIYEPFIIYKLVVGINKHLSE